MRGQKSRVRNSNPDFAPQRLVALHGTKLSDRQFPGVAIQLGALNQAQKSTLRVVHLKIHLRSKLLPMILTPFYGP